MSLRTRLFFMIVGVGGLPVATLGGPVTVTAGGTVSVITWPAATSPTTGSVAGSSADRAA